MGQRQDNRLGVGDKVSFYFVTGIVKGTVIEDRGNIGRCGRQLVRIRQDNSGNEYELPAEELVKMEQHV
jgi:hypothetical protein